MESTSFLKSLFLALSSLLLSLWPVQPQIIPDRTLGQENSLIHPEVINGIDSDRIDGGARRGNNLFHSFQDFSIGEGRGAYFSNPTGIANIFSRVTGGKISQILGTLGVLGNANLYLLNPNGILFGPNSQLDIKGSFLATTADSFQFSSNYAFSAVNPNIPPLLTVNIPIGLQFRKNAQAIVNQSQNGLNTEKNITLVGGDISFDGGKIISPSSNVNLSSISGNGIVNLQTSENTIEVSIPANLERGNIVFNDGSGINVRGNNSGSITINAKNLNIDGESTRLRAGITAGSETINSQVGDINF